METEPMDTATGGGSADAAEVAVVDPLCPQRMNFDMIDLMSYEIIMDRRNRKERAGQLNYYLDRIGGTGPPTYGRIHNRLSISCLLQEFCSRDAYPRKTWPPDNDAGGGGGGEDTYDDPETTPLVAMKSDGWDMYTLMFKNTKKDVLRMDANAVVLPIVLKEMSAAIGDDAADSDDNNGGAGEDNKIVRYNDSLRDDRINKELVNNAIFTRKYEEIVISMQFHQAMSTFRGKLEKAVDADDGVDENGNIVSVSAEELAEFSNYINTTFHDDWGAGARDLLSDLIVEYTDDTIGFKPISEFRKIYSRKEFSLDRFQVKVERLLSKWNDAVLDPPRFASLGYGKQVFPSTANRPEPKGRRQREKRRAPPPQEEPEEDAPPPMPDEEEYEADLEESVVKKASRKRRVSDGDDDNEREEQDVGPTGTTKRKKRRGKRDRVSIENVKDNHAPVEDGPEVKELTKARDHLREEVDDPLDDMRALASTAAGPSAAAVAKAAAKKKAQEVARKRGDDAVTPELYKKKKSAKTLKFTDSEEEDSEDEDDAKAGTTLSEVPDRPVIRKEPSSAEKKPKPATQMLTHREHLPTGAIKRKKFTEEEKSAIKLGVERFGFGKWAKIKEYYSDELRDRTSVNIKDCYRTMMKKNEV